MTKPIKQQTTPLENNAAPQAVTNVTSPNVKFQGKFQGSKYSGKKFETIKRKDDHGNLLHEEVLKLRRVGATNSGGKVISYSAFCVVGNGKGSVGCGLGKAKEVSKAIEKARNKAINKMIHLKFFDLNKIPYPIKVKHCGTLMYLKAAKKGLLCNFIGKKIFKAAGISQVNCKMLGARSVINSAQTIMKGLASLESIYHIAKRRNKTVDYIVKQKKVVIYNNLEGSSQ